MVAEHFTSEEIDELLRAAVQLWETEDAASLERRRQDLLHRARTAVRDRYARRTDPQTTDLAAWATRSGLTAEDLDGLIHDIYAGRATALSNTGLAAQIACLIDTHGLPTARIMLQQLTTSGS